ncbi:MAG: class I SAM-dependent methyltransferase [Acidimicrobiia bacterium]|nr:class I SAM-dependent methyltransferase [Acidimicrobiia bacterium]
MRPTRVPGSFRDPAGHLFVADGTLYRRIEPAGREGFDRLMDSGAYDALVRDGLLLPHEDAGEDQGARIIEPEPIQFISYPYEWCFSQLRDAALLTLRAQRTAMRFGMSLKDASAYNVQFRRGRPVFIDTLSFEPLGSGPWVAYRQFCQHFYAPLLLWSNSDGQLGRLSQAFIDGVPLPLASSLLPRASFLRAGPLLHVHLHAKAEQRLAARKGPPCASGPADAGRGFTPRHSVSRRMDALLDSLASAVSNTSWKAASHWSGYYADQPSYTDEGQAAKIATVTQWLDRLRPGTVWDIGANTGRYSRIAGQHAPLVVALDGDPACVETMYCEARAEKLEYLLPLVSDMSNPSPAIGWANEERFTLEQRGPADVALALALVHHLAIGNNVPFPAIAAYFSRLARRLIVEFVPKDDAMVRGMLSGRRDVFDTYTPAHFEEAFAAHFRVEERAPLAPSNRVLYLLDAR